MRSAPLGAALAAAAAARSCYPGSSAMLKTFPASPAQLFHRDADYLGFPTVVSRQILQAADVQLELLNQSFLRLQFRFKAPVVLGQLSVLA